MWVPNHYERRSSRISATGVSLPLDPCRSNCGCVDGCFTFAPRLSSEARDRNIIKRLRNAIARRPSSEMRNINNAERHDLDTFLSRSGSGNFRAQTHDPKAMADLLPDGFIWTPFSSDLDQAIFESTYTSPKPLQICFQMASFGYLSFQIRIRQF